MELTNEDLEAIGLEPVEGGGVRPQGPAGYFENSRFISAYLGHEVKRAGHLRVGQDGSLWSYRGGVYRPNGDAFAAEYVRTALKTRFQERHLREVLAWLRAEQPSVSEQPNPSTINVANGLLDWRTGTLHPHDPDRPSTLQVPVLWRPEATCPRIQQYLSEVLPADAVALAEEVAAYCLLASNPYRKAVMLLGSGRNGKTTMLELLRSLLGPENVSSIPLQALGEQRFATVELRGKLANLAGDLDARALRYSDTFKMLTGNDSITAERKYHQRRVTFSSYATLIFSANEPPPSFDQSDAYFDRWLTLPFPRRFSEEEADPHLLAKLTTSAELEGFLVRSVEALHRLMVRGRFEEPPSVRAAAHDYRERVDTVGAFLAEECVTEPSAEVRPGALWAAYRSWCERTDRHRVSPQQFRQRLERHLGPDARGARDGARYWKGIRLVSDAA